MYHHKIRWHETSLHKQWLRIKKLRSCEEKYHLDNNLPTEDILQFELRNAMMVVIPTFLAVYEVLPVFFNDSIHCHFLFSHIIFCEDEDNSCLCWSSFVGTPGRFSGDHLIYSLHYKFTVHAPNIHSDSVMAHDGRLKACAPGAERCELGDSQPATENNKYMELSSENYWRTSWLTIHQQLESRFSTVGWKLKIISQKSTKILL